MADPEKKVESRKLKVEGQRKTKLKKRKEITQRNTECRGTKEHRGDDNSWEMGGAQKQKRPDGGRGALFYRT
jgi:hypothetical protein